jgi:hypothetical protein
VFQARPADLHNLKQRFSDEINAIPSAILLRVLESILTICISSSNLMGDI